MNQIESRDAAGAFTFTEPPVVVATTAITVAMSLPALAPAPEKLRPDPLPSHM